MSGVGDAMQPASEFRFLGNEFWERRFNRWTQALRFPKELSTGDGR